jgi:4-carboxymuconolactone decarboxylase
MKLPIVAAFALLAGVTMSQAEDRFSTLQPEQMNAEQKKLLEAIVSGPRSQNYGSDAIGRVLRTGPFNAWMRSPELGIRLQAVGEYVRFKTSIPQRLNELAILITAREWTSQYEWYAHHALAMKAGLDPAIADDIAAGKRPANMKDDEAAVYDFCIELHRSKKVSDANFQRVKVLFGEQGAVELMGVSGYYTAVSMTLNVAQIPIPDGNPLPLKPLD